MTIKATAMAWGNVTVAVTATQILATRRRKGFIIVNNSANTIYLGGTNSVTLANGIPLEPDDVYSNDDWIGPIWGIAEANSNVRYHEFYW